MHTHLHACIYVCSEIKTTKIPPPPLAHGKVNTIFLQMKSKCLMLFKQNSKNFVKKKKREKKKICSWHKYPVCKSLYFQCTKCTGFGFFNLTCPLSWILNRIKHKLHISAHILCFSAPCSHFPSFKWVMIILCELLSHARVTSES